MPANLLNDNVNDEIDISFDSELSGSEYGAYNKSSNIKTLKDKLLDIWTIYDDDNE